MILCSTAPSMLEIIQQLQDIIVPQYSSYLPSRALCICMEFIIKSILQHFHLYHFLLTQPQTTDLTTLNLHVDTADNDIPSLHEGVEQDLWLKEKRKLEIESAYEAKSKELETTGAQSASRARADLDLVCEQALAAFSDGPRKMSLEQVSAIVSELIKAHIGASLVTISHSLQKQYLDLDYRLEQLEALADIEHKEANPHSSKTPSRNQSRATAGSTY